MELLAHSCCIRVREDVCTSTRNVHQMARHSTQAFRPPHNMRKLRSPSSESQPQLMRTMRAHKKSKRVRLSTATSWLLSGGEGTRLLCSCTPKSFAALVTSGPSATGAESPDFLPPTSLLRFHFCTASWPTLASIAPRLDS